MTATPRHAALVLVALAAAACQSDDAAPTDPTTEALAPSAAVVREVETFPFWERGPWPGEGEYTAIYFYVADPGVVPTDFNLLGLFDFRALGAELAVAGTEVWMDESAPAPRNLRLHGIAPVHFWFIPRSVLLSAAEDGFVNTEELLASGSVLVGTASSFVEQINPTLGGANRGLLQTVAKGELEDGRSFRYTLKSHFDTETGAPLGERSESVTIR